MIVLCYFAIVLLSFTRISMWLQIALTLAPPVLISVFSHDAVPAKVGVVAVVGALALYTPLAFLGSFFISGGFRAAFRRLRVIYFLFVLCLFVVLVFNLTQLI